MELYIGAIVESVDGQDAGTVERAIVDLATNEVTHYVVHSEIGRRRDVVVPAALADERERILSIRISLAELDNMPEYLEARFGLPQLGLQRAPEERLSPRKEMTAPQLPEDGTIELSRCEPVQCMDGEVGALEGIVVDELTDEVTDLIVSVTRLRKDVAVPTAWASRLGPTRIQLQCSKSEVESLAR